MFQTSFQIGDNYVPVRDIVDQFKHEDFPGNIQQPLFWKLFPFWEHFLKPIVVILSV